MARILAGESRRSHLGEEEKKAVSIYDVARVAGVSYSTVSRAFSKASSVAQDTHSRIMDVARELGYRPSALARGLSGGRTQSVGIVWSMSRRSPGFMAAHDISLLAYRRGYVTNIMEHNGQTNILLRDLEELARRRVDAVVLGMTGTGAAYHEAKDLLTQFHATVVVTDVSDDPRDIPEIDRVVHDRTAAFREVIDYFARTGRKHVGCIMSMPTDDDPERGNSARNKADAIRQEARRHGVKVFPIDLKGRSPFLDPYAVSEAMDQHVQQHGMDLDALFCGSDQTAVGAIAWLKQRTLRVPEDVAVIGMNDMAIDNLLDPPLASIHRYDDTLAQVVDRMLAARLKQPDLPRQDETIRMEFVWRASAGPRLI